MKRLLFLFSLSTAVAFGQIDEVKEHYNLGLQKFKANDYKGAIAELTQAIRLNPAYADALNVRGMAKSNLEDYYGAIADYSKAIELNPNAANAYFNRGYDKDELAD